MTDLQDQDQDLYDELLLASKALVEQADSLPERFCTMYSSLASEQPLGESFLIDRLYQQIQAYEEQYDVLYQELGILCPPLQSHASQASQVFTTLLELFQLANTVYSEQPELAVYENALHSVHQLLDTGSFSSPSDPQARAVLKTLLSLAWTRSTSKATPEQYMKHVKAQQGGKRKTRKQKRKSTSA